MDIKDRKDKVDFIKRQMERSGNELLKVLKRAHPRASLTMVDFESGATAEVYPNGNFPLYYELSGTALEDTAEVKLSFVCDNSEYSIDKREIELDLHHAVFYKDFAFLTNVVVEEV